MRVEQFWWRAAWRSLRRQPLPLMLLILGITAGVAVVTAVQLSTASAQHSYSQAVARLTSGITHRIQSPTGVPEQLYVKIRRAPEQWKAWPVVRLSGQLPDGRGLQILGLDLLIDERLNRGGGPQQRLLQPGDLITEPVVIMNPETAKRLGLEIGDPLRLKVAQHDAELHIAALSTALMPGQILMDIGQALALSDSPHLLTSIGLNLMGALPSALKDLLPEGVELVAVTDSEPPRLGEALFFNLNAMALLALVMGALVVFSAVTLSLRIRQPLFASWRLAGVGAGRMLGWVLLELALLALLSTLAGILLGGWLAQVLLPLLVASLSVFEAPPLPELQLTVEALLGLLALGLGSTLLAAAWPCWRLYQQSPLTLQFPPVESLELARSNFRPWLLAGLLLPPLIYLVFIPASLIGLYGVLIWFTLVFALALQPVQRVIANGLMDVLPGKPLLLIILRDGLRQRFYSTGTMLVLLITLSTAIAINGMTASFYSAFSQWLTQRLNADLYITGSGIEPLAQQLSQRGEIADMDRRWRQPVTIQGQQLFVYGGDYIAQARSGYAFAAGDESTLWQRLQTEPVALISEPLARHLSLSVGDALPFVAGGKTLEVVGIYYDYGSYQGQVLTGTDTFAALFPSPSAYGLRLWLMDANTAESAQNWPALAAFQTSTIKPLIQRTEQLFEQTFLITDILQLLLLVIALIAIAANLLAMQLARKAELQRFRALGMSRKTRGGLLLGQALMLAVTAAVLALPLGELLAWLLTEQVQKNAFGWSIPWQYEFSRSVIALLAAVLATSLVALYPAIGQEVNDEN